MWTGGGFERDATRALTSPISKNGVQQAASLAAFSGAFGSIPMFRADFLYGSSKSVEVRPKLPFVRKSNELDQTEQQTLTLLRLSSQKAETIYQLVQDFVQMVRHRQGEKLDAWLIQVASSHLPDLRREAFGIERDKAAVAAGLTLS